MLSVNVNLSRWYAGIIAIVRNTFRLRQDFISMMNHAYILDFGIRILDLRYSACLINRASMLRQIGYAGQERYHRSKIPPGRRPLCPLWLPARRGRRPKSKIKNLQWEVIQAGNTSVTVVPTFGVLLISIRPPWASMIVLQRLKPKP
jgi:hypothetical protein